MNRLFLTAAVIACSASFARAGSAIVAAQIKAPIYFNLFWDSNWDADNPGMTMTQINAYTQALTLSSYFGGLGEYGIAGAAFGGGMKVLPVCGANPPARPSAAEVLAFVKCESLLPPIKGSSAVINVFLPNHVLQRDDAGAIPDFVGITKGVIEACRGQYGSYHSLTGNFSPVGGPYYTAIFADDSCVTGLPMLLTNLTHEMVEAATDPTAALSVVLAAGGGEVGDKCPSTTTAFGVPNSFSAPGVPVSAGLVSGYFSNRSGACLTGFTSGVTPSVNLQFSWPNNLAVGAPALTITGSGFGTLPPGLATWSGNTPTPVALPASLSLPYLAVVDGNFGGVWTAGDELTSGGNIPLSIQSWTNTAITLNGFGVGFGSGGVVVKPGDNLSVIVCNPVSGMCGTAGMKVPQPSPPVIASVTPAVAPEAGGTFVTISGSGFTTMNDVEVDFDLEPASDIQVMGPDTIIAAVPSNPRRSDSGEVTVITSNGGSNGFPFRYCAPSVLSVSPGSGPGAGGGSVTITGSCFTGTQGVTFGPVAARSFTVVDDAHITATPPSDCVPTPADSTAYQNVPVRVTSPGADAGTTATSVENVFYSYVEHDVSCPTRTSYCPPTVASISPNRGPFTGSAGQKVTITGTCLAYAQAVNFGATSSLGFTVADDQHITAYPITNCTAPTPAVPSYRPAVVDVTVTAVGSSPGTSVTSARSAADVYRFMGASPSCRPIPRLPPKAQAAKK